MAQGRSRGNGEGSVHRRKGGGWVATLHLGYADGKRVRRSFYTRTKALALARLDEAKAEIARGLPVGGRRRLDEWLSYWLREIAQPRVRTRTYLGYESIIRNHLIPQLGRSRLRDLTPEHVRRFQREQLGRGLGPRAIQHQHAVLRMALRSAEAEGEVARNVARIVAAPKVVPRKVEALPPEGARAILAAVEGDRLEALYHVFIALGLRQGEALGLTWTDVDLDEVADEDERAVRVTKTLARIKREFVFEPCKTKESKRILDLAPELARTLHAHRDRQAFERQVAEDLWEGERWGSLVFTTETGAPLHGTHVLRRFQALMKAAGLDAHTRIHDLRHYAAHLALASGASPKTVQDLLGHRLISTTMDIYAASIPDDRRKASRAVAAALYG
jgi:integrase